MVTGATFSKIKDPRHQGYVEHRLSDILTIIMVAVLCGLGTLSDLVIFANERKEFFKKHFDIEKIPSKSTFSRILQIIDGRQVAQSIIETMQNKAFGKVVAVDGKAICSTARGSTQTLQILTAYLTESGVTLAQEKIHEKTNEIPVFQEMLEWLNVKNKIVTADAMHCQKETCKRISQKGGDYVLGLKQNQRELYDNARLFLDNDILGVERYDAPTEKGHGRTEKRTCIKFSDVKKLPGYEKWKGLKCVFAIEKETEIQGKISISTNYYVSSLNEPPKRLMELAREYWKIESMHWMLDVSFKEDDQQFISDDAHEAMNAYRKHSLCVHKNYVLSHNLKIPFKANMLRCLLDENLLISVIRFL